MRESKTILNSFEFTDKYIFTFKTFLIFTLMQHLSFQNFCHFISAKHLSPFSKYNQANFILNDLLLQMNIRHKICELVVIVIGITKTIATFLTLDIHCRL